MLGWTFKIFSDWLASASLCDTWKIPKVSSVPQRAYPHSTLSYPFIMGDKPGNSKWKKQFKDIVICQKKTLCTCLENPAQQEWIYDNIKLVKLLLSQTKGQKYSFDTKTISKRNTRHTQDNLVLSYEAFLITFPLTYTQLA